MLKTTTTHAGSADVPSWRTRLLGPVATGPYAADTVAFWRRMLVLRVVVGGALIGALFLDYSGRAQLLVGVAAAGGFAGTAVLWRTVTRRKAYPPAAVWMDQVAVGVVCIIVPEMLPIGLLATLANLSLVGTVLGRKTALVLGATTALLLGAAVARPGHPAQGGLYVFGMTAAFAVVTSTIGYGRVHQRLNDRYDTIVDKLGLVVWEATDDTLVHISDTITPMLGRSASWFLEHDWTEYIHPDDHEAIREHQRRVHRGETGWNTHRVLDADGTVHWVEEFAASTAPVDGELFRSFGMFFDVTRKHEREHEATQWGAVVSQLSMPVFVTRLVDPDDDTSLVIEAANPIARAMISRRVGDAIGTRVATTFPELATNGFVALAADVARTGRSRVLPVVVPVFHDEKVRAMTTHLLALPDDAVAMVWIDATDAIDAGDIAASVVHEATFDHLTGLANRRALHRRLGQAVHVDGAGDPIGLLLIDLDSFKDVNDSLGYVFGDALLRAVAGRLRELVGDRGTVYRMGADEFAVVLPGPSSESCAGLAGVILGSLDTPFDLDGFTVLSGATVGSARYPQDATDADTLVQRADMSLHRAKRLNSGVASYSPDTDRSSARRLTLLADLRRAIDAHELVPYYQPITDLSTGRLVAAEALVRWHHPEHGTIMPLEFIEGAEVSGLVGPLTAALATQVAADLGRWVHAGHELSVSINLSARNVHDRHLAVMLGDLLTTHRLPPGSLCLEITERTVMQDLAQARATLSDLRDRHFEVAVDDFGTGYSSLGVLNSIPLDELKLDKAFIDDLAAGDARVVRSVIELAHNLGLRVVAEGVEQPETLRLLSALGCDRAQGWAIARPMPAEALTELLSSAGSGGHWYVTAPGEHAVGIEQR